MTEIDRLAEVASEHDKHGHDEDGRCVELQHAKGLPTTGRWRTQRAVLQGNAYDLARQPAA